MTGKSTYRPSLYSWIPRWIVLGCLMLGAGRAATAQDESDTNGTTTTSRVGEIYVRQSDQVVGIFRDAHLRPGESAQEVVAVFGDAIAEGPVRGEVISVFGNVTVTEDVGDVVVAVFGNVTIGPDVEVGDVVVVIGGQLHLDPTAHVGGEVVVIPLPGFTGLSTWLRESVFRGCLYQYDQRSTWVFVGVLLLFNLALGALFRGPVANGVRALERKPAMTLINGVLTATLLPPLMFLLTITGVGVLVLPFLLAAVLFTTWLGMLSLFRFCGAQFGFNHQPLLALAFGHLLFAAIFAVPYVGLAAWSLVALLGVGTALTSISEARRRESEINGGSAPRTEPSAPPTTPPEGSPAVTAAAPPPPAATSQPSQATAPPPPPRQPAAGPPPLGAPGNAFAASTSVPSALPGMFPRAGFAPRLAATALDLLVVFIAARFLRSMDLFLFLWLGYHVALWTWRQTTLGGIVLHLRIERLDGRPVDFGTALIRALSSALSLVALGLGFLWVLWDSENQSWHDKIAGTTIVRTPRGTPLF